MNISKIEVLHREQGLSSTASKSNSTTISSKTTMASTTKSTSSSSGAAAAAAGETAKPLTPNEKEALLNIPGNSRCCDCGQSKPEWASLTLATMICLDCSGQHRGLGTHISFVRSIKMDSWTPKQLKRMKLGGNKSIQEFYESHNLTTTTTTNIRERYDTQVGDLYSQILTAKLEGKPIPTELPPKRIPKAKPQNSKPMTGFGSTAHPSEIRKQQKQKRKKIAVVVGSAIMGVGAVAWGLSSSRSGNGGGRGGNSKTSTTNPTGSSPSATS